MTLILNKKQSNEKINQMREKNACMAIFCSASHWNSEAILLAASRYAKKRGISDIPISIAMTFNYPHMPQAKRVTYSKNAKYGFISNMTHINLLCGQDDSPYKNVSVLPHLDHANPTRDLWALTSGTEYLSSVMFDTQDVVDENAINLTKEYVKEYGDKVLIEGIMEQLSVLGNIKIIKNEDYIEKAVKFVKNTNVDFLVADLGTEQQSSSIGKSTYLTNRAINLTKALNKKMLVLHGTSSLTSDQMISIKDDGVIRVNMWTRIVREAGQFAANNIVNKYDKIKDGYFEQSDSKQYIYDSIEKAADIMEEIMDIIGYGRLA
ncbi:MAG: class II fructose-bisphosphate aldolase [Clostridiales bacterium]|nr:class II fructose-bisphosphate aldolase [Clostridiales bacterium]